MSTVARVMLSPSPSCHGNASVLLGLALCAFQCRLAARGLVKVLLLVLPPPNPHAHAHAHAHHYLYH
jgi:hypothetical protein